MFDASTPEFIRRLEALFSRATDALARRSTLDRLLHVEQNLQVTKDSIKFLWDLCFDGMVLDYAVCWDDSENTKGSIPKLTKRLRGTNKTDFLRYAGPSGDFDARESVCERVKSIQDSISPHLKVIEELRNEYIAHQGRIGVFEHPKIPAQSLETVHEQTFLVLNVLGKLVGRVPSLDYFMNAGVELVNKLPQHDTLGAAGRTKERGLPLS